ncbi:MAG TPA: hypothetical protein VGB05_03715 [Pyrinomonadaceae bacterium]
MSLKIVKRPRRVIALGGEPDAPLCVLEESPNRKTGRQQRLRYGIS